MPKIVLSASPRIIKDTSFLMPRRLGGWLYITFSSKLLHSHGEVIITGERLENLYLCSANKSFELGKDLYRALRAVTRDLGFCGLI